MKLELDKPLTQEPLPDWMAKLELRDIELTTKPEDISDDCPPCFGCNNPTVKGNIRYLNGGDTVVVRAFGPGYICPLDGVEHISDATWEEFLNASLRIFEAAGDKQGVERTRTEMTRG